MTPLDKLIAHWDRRAQECNEEIDLLVERWEQTVRHEARKMTERDLKRMCQTWEDERRIARDTAAWLRTVQNREPKLPVVTRDP